MRILKLMFILTLVMFAHSDNNSSVEVISKLGEFIGSVLETYTSQIELLLIVFSLIVSLILAFVSIIGYSKSKSITSKVEENRNKIDEFQKETYIQFEKHKEELKEEIKEEVLQQIVYVSDEVSQKVEEHAYRKINKNINKLTDEILERRFAYQKLIYKVNQVKKLEYERVLKSAKTIDEKLEEITIIQAKYNEINNQNIPKLFSKNIKDVAIPVAEKLSESKEVAHIIKKELEKLLEDEDYSFVDREDIREVLKDYYAWKEEKKES